MKIFVVTAHRVQVVSDHSYVVGVFDDFEVAKKAADIEQLNRAGKYECQINNYTLNELPEELEWEY